MAVQAGLGPQMVSILHRRPYIDTLKRSTTVDIPDLSILAGD